MSEPVKQHYIPRSYLKNFAHCNNKKKCLVDVFYKKEDIIRENIDTKSICYKKHLYTLNTKDDNKKYELELYYANNVDGEFQNIYKLLIDKNKNVLTKEEKFKVLYVCLSFYFRTPIHLNHINSFTNEYFDRLKMYADENGYVKTKVFGGTEIHVDELDKLKEKEKDRNKIRFHVEHMSKWVEYVQHKYECTINVIEIQDKDAYLITSDNPVIIRERRSNLFLGLFNPENIITMPLDPKHFLEIHPNTLANDEYEIQRLIHDTDYVFTTNAMTQQNAYNLLIGKRNTIDYHFKLQEKYEDPTNGQKLIEKAKSKLMGLQLFHQLVQDKGIFSSEAIKQLKKMHSLEHYSNDRQIEGLVKMYKKFGKW